MTRPPWSTVLFDFDGTLANTIPLIIASYRATIEHCGLEPADDALIRSWIGRTLPDMLNELVGAERLDEVAAFYSAWQVDHIDDLLRPYPGVDALVAGLVAAGATVGVVTSRRRAGAETLAQALGLHEHVPVLVAMEDTDRHKPDAAPLLAAAHGLRVEPGDCVYVGDAVVDLAAADAAGMAGIGVTWGAGLPDALRAQPSVAVVDTVDELRALVLG